MTFQATASGRASWCLALSLASVHLVSSVDRHIPTLVLSAIQLEFSLTDTDLGFLHGTAYVLFYAIAIVPVGILADRYDRRRIVMGGLIIWTIGTAACGLSQSYTQLVAARMVVGLGQAALVPTAISLIAESFGSRRMGRPIAIFTAAATLGRGVALFGGGVLLAWIINRGIPSALAPWRALFLLSLVLNLIALAWYFTTRAGPRAPGEVAPTRDLARAVAARWPVYLAYFGGAAASITLVQIIAAWTPTILVRSFGLTASESGLLFGPIVLSFGPAGNLVGGWVVDSLERRGVTGAPALANALSLIAAIGAGSILCSAQTLPIAVTGLMATTFFLGMTTPTGLVGIQNLTPPAIRGRVTALFVLCVTLVSLGAGPVVVGWLSDQFHDGVNGLRLAVLVAFWGVGCLGVLSSAAANRLDRTAV
ncbi:MAG: MFS transporter [Hoeflea sp.]|uniref:MFS transporter n=1 Tax=Hoeflea sp. TaxID=1940281 RepID=UPI001DCF07AF|nr:MFS transporter [Hoeflea sp.]MBU4529911.1 MFS transporter [Alphaproteobacteria bacterium]MBU4547068.1 MFS transporter [Alphaproteobacteria bacterium]MBU4548681.1 MFS transporter [Alphaproteobacteria bacterium]MBV1722404.1 MFS transporter [Hoeflea sp.]MBV1762440.1 MFS transporter [Hoeflea sp.]